MRLKQKKDEVDFFVTVDDNDTVLDVKNKLSEKINTKSDELVLVYKKQILEDHVNIKEYKIPLDDYVIFYSRIDYIAAYAVDDIDYIRISNRLSDQINKNVFNTFSDVYLKFVCTNFNYETIRSKFPVVLIYKDVIKYLSKSIDIPRKHIKLFKDENELYSIMSNKDLLDIINSLTIQSNEINIYYQIISDIDKIIKLSLIESGTWGEMYKCIEIESNRKLTLKQFDTAKNPAQKELFETEFEILSLIKSHPRIISLERKFEKENELYILLESYPGDSLGKFIQHNGNLQEIKISKYSKQILEALEYLYEKRIIHRQIKGTNIILGEDDNIKLSNFGLAKYLGKIASNNLSDAVVISNVGDPNWTAPEVINGECYGIFVDMWSFGAVVIEMLTGHPPFHNVKMFQILSRLANEKKVEYNPPIESSSEIINFISLSMKSDPFQRLTAKELLQHDFITRY